MVLRISGNRNKLHSARPRNTANRQALALSRPPEPWQFLMADRATRIASPRDLYLKAALRLCGSGVMSPAARGVIVNLSSAAIDSDSAAGQWDRLGTAESEAALRGKVSVDDLTMQALYLASDTSRFATGQTLRINGGSAMPW